MKLKSLLATACLAAAAIPSAADASIVISSFPGNPGFLTGTISYAPAALNLSVGIGRFELIGTEQPGGAPVDFLTYCADILHHIHTGSFEISPLSTLVADATTRSRLNALVSNADPLIAAAGTLAAKKDISAAVQLAVWEILYEAGSNSYSFATGDFRSSGGNTGNARTLATTYLSNVTGGTWTAAPGTRVDLLYSPTNQSQLFLSAVPEPATWAMMIGGFGLVGGAMRRRRISPAVVTA